MVEEVAAPKPGSFIHIELTSSDPPSTLKFFEQVFGWEFQSQPQFEYHTFTAPSGPGGGLSKPMEGQAPAILNYILSADLDGDLQRIRDAGGTVLREKNEIPGVGWFAVFQEPAGLTLALFQALSPTRGPTARAGGRGRKRPRRGRTTRRGARG